MSNETAAPLRVTSSAIEDGTVIVAVAGEVDMSTARLLATELARLVDGGASRIVIDATDATFLDSTGISILVSTHKALALTDGRIEIREARRVIARTMEISGVSQLIPTSAIAAEPPIST